jgi:hypothetical protein
VKKVFKAYTTDKPKTYQNELEVLESMEMIAKVMLKPNIYLEFVHFINQIDRLV